MKNIELLSPAGDFDRLKLAIQYGADAVYVGGQKFGLRSAATIANDELREAVQYAHAHGKRIYVTVNIFARNHDFAELEKHLKFLESIGVDAVIVSDLGVLRLVREKTKLDAHISTQANVLNKYTAEEYVKLGAKRIILARECSLDEIKEIAAHLRGRLEIEVFVHGAMCVSYSGRCLLSAYTTGREANRGECAHPCRWKYALMEEKRPNEYFPVEQDNHGTYIMNSRDLCLINHLDELKKAGVTCFKIEGRMKSEYYVATVTNAYRRAMNGERFNRMAELDKVSHRPWTTGFVFQNAETMFTPDSKTTGAYEVTARCLGGNAVSLRNSFAAGDTLEILSPGAHHNKTFAVTITEGSPANKAGHTYHIGCPYPLNAGDFLRKPVI